MSLRHVFSSELATKCRFCGCPIADDCVSLSTVDAAKLSNWSVARTGVPIAEESAAATWCCMNCVREAKRISETNPLDEDTAFRGMSSKIDIFITSKAEDWMKSCSVAAARLPEDEVMRLTNCSSQEIFIKQEVEEIEEEEQEVVIEEQERVVKAEVFDVKGEIMEVDHNDSDFLSSDRVIHHQGETRQKIACRHCHLMIPSGSIKKHIKTSSCPFCCKISFPCLGQLRCHKADCFKKCPLCSKRVKTNLQLDKHLNASHKTKDGYWQNNKVVPWTHVCNKCNEGFPTKNKLLKHKGTCNGQYVCDTCGAKYQLKYSFLCHLQKEHGFFHRKRSLRIHNENWSCSSNLRVSVACKYCGNNFKESVLPRHEILCQRKKESDIYRLQEQTTSTKHLLICQMCGKNLRSKESLDRHLNTIHKKEMLPLQCVHCQLNIADYIKRRDHYCPSRPKVSCSECNLVMYQEYLFYHQVTYKCCKCNLSFPCESLFKQHLTERTYPCQVCESVFCDIPSLTNHVNSEHGKDNDVIVTWTGLEYSHLPYKCDTCKIYFGTINEWNKHVKVYHKEHPCELCAKISKGLIHKIAELKTVMNVFESLSEFETESTPRATSPPKSPEQFPCDKCDETFDSKTDLLRHFSTTHDDHTQRRQEFTCTICGDSCVSKIALTSHLKVNHTCSKYVCCRRCRRTYLQSMAKNHNLLYHKKDYSGPGKKLVIFTCSVCGWDTNKRNILATHLLRVHNIGRFEKECSHCSEVFSTLGLKKAHICAKRPKVECVHCSHTMFEEYLLEHQLEQTCKSCGQTYPCEVSFIRHTNDRSFPCLLCGQDFCNMFSLTKHAKRKHSKVKNVDFPWEGIRHYEKNLKCQDCRKFFPSKEYLQSHLDTYHGGAVCNLCAHWMPLGPEKMESHIKNTHILISPYFQAMSEESQKILSTIVLDNAPNTSSAIAGHSGDG